MSSSASGKSSIAIVGNGNIGTPIVHSLISNGFTVRMLVRQKGLSNGLHELDQIGAEKVFVDYYDKQTLNNALHNIDVLISTLGIEALSSSKRIQHNLADAAKEEGVRLFIPSMWGLDYANPEVVNRQTLNNGIQAKIEILNYLDSIQLPWLAISIGIFASLTLSEFFGIDGKSGKAELLVDSSKKIIFSDLNDVSNFTSALLLNSSEYTNKGGRWVYTQSFIATFSDILKEAQEVEETKFTITETQNQSEGEVAWVLSALNKGWGYHESNDNGRIGFIPKSDLNSNVRENLKIIRSFE